ncbi:endonuclease/exonuclease/phosphatase family protein [Streptomyces sp. WMMC905]|uniref:endonuclease/exonuclease/phosphatase family protein n=1 Tax=Streptomyces sp. WMMC905 TaxID=3404123 RepID=UPI003B954C54
MAQQAYVRDTDDEGSRPVPRGDRLRRLLARYAGGWRERRTWRRGLITAALALASAAVMAGHAFIPNTVGNLGSLVETFLPWLGLSVPLLLIVALARRSASALIAVMVPSVVWLSMFGGLLSDKTGSGGDLTVVTHNVNADNLDPGGTARAVAAAGADVLALEELKESAVPTYEEALASGYPYHEVVGTVGLWSKYPLSDARSVDIELGWERAMRATVDAPAGRVAVYVAHLPSVRVRLEAGFTAGQRDESADALGAAITGERLDRVVLLGDLNGTMNDRSLQAVTSQMRSTQGAAGDGFGFSWPASFPMARIDQIMVKGVEPVASWTLPATGSDHLPVAARVSFDDAAS